MLWQNHDEFDGPSTVIYLATYPPNCPQKGQDGWDLGPIMRCESMLTFSFVCVTAAANITVHIHLSTLNGVTKADNIITKEVDQ